MERFPRAGAGRAGVSLAKEHSCAPRLNARPTKRVRFSKLLSAIPLLSLALFSGGCAAQPASWQELVDRQTTGAAASAVLVSRCSDEPARDAAHQRMGSTLRTALKGISQAAQVPRASVEAYAAESYRTKIHALWQSTEGHPCVRMDRLNDLAWHFGYPRPGD